MLLQILIVDLGLCANKKNLKGVYLSHLMNTQYYYCI
jgi:hypothetical protein